jgi:Carboxypeptidase regulatory-like domain
MAGISRLLLIVLLAGLPATTPATLLAQSDNSSIAGVITDPSGAVVGAASITVTSEQTGAERRTASNKSGFYTIAGLAPGKYTVRVVAPGFDMVTSTNNNLDPAIPSTVNISLAVGRATQSVEVKANETTLQADSSTLGRVITSSQADNLPLDGRNPIYLALTKAGITSITSTVSSSNFSTGLGAININGGRERDNLLTYDGAVAVRVRASGDSVGTPDLDAVQEVQVLATNYPAEYGRSIGGQIRIITKSGGERFHGSAYEYFQNPVLNANTWVRNDNANNANPDYPAALKTNSVAPFTYNQFGFVFDGPLYIPRVLPRGKVFFLYSEAFVRNPQLSTATDTVPNAAFRTGDFSSLITGNIKTNHYIKDPQSTLPCSVSTGGPGCFSSNGVPNVIPQSRLSPNGVGLLTAFPTPTPGFQIGSANLLETAHYPIQQQIDSGNLDILPTEKDYIRFRLVHFYYHEINPFATSTYDVVPRIYSRPNQTGSLDYVHTFSARMTNEFLFTASHDAARLSIDTSTGTYNRANYGITYPYLFPSGKDLPNKIPTIAFDTTGITTLDGSTYPSHSQGEIFDFADTVTRIIGNHTVRAGALYERAGENDDDQIAFANSTPGQTNNQNGKFDFSSTNTNGTGYDIADAALGLFNSYSEIGPRNETPSRANMFEFFGQDSWKATSKLHLEFGLRYTSIHPFYSIWNNAGTFAPAFYNPATAVQVNPSTGNPVAGSGDPLDGTVLFGSGFTASAASHVPIAASGQYNYLFHDLPRGYIHVQKYLFQPRVGIAYQLNNKTVLRTGFGRYTSRQGTSDNVFLGGFAPLQQVVSTSGGSADNPGGTAVGTGSYPTLSGDISQASPQPEAYIWNASVERDLGFDTVADISYVGRHALHQQFEADVNQAPIGTAQAFGTSGVNAHRPYLGYAAITEVYQGDTAFYQGLQIDVNHRFSHSLGFGVAYTYAHSSDCGSFQKNFLPNADDTKGLCGTADYDLRQVLVLNSVYRIPFRSGNRLANEALGGWQLSQAYQFQTGTPFNVATSQDIAGVGAGFQGQFLQIAPGAQLRGNGKFSVGADSNSWFNASAFSLPAAGTFTSQHNRNLIYGPGQANFNASLQKQFATFENQSLSFRFDAFDFPNHPNWAAPDSTYTDATFGKVTSKSGQRAMQASLRYSF